jgi:hypothetical protein
MDQKARDTPGCRGEVGGAARVAVKNIARPVRVYRLRLDGGRHPRACVGGRPTVVRSRRPRPSTRRRLHVQLPQPPHLDSVRSEAPADGGSSLGFWLAGVLGLSTGGPIVGWVVAVLGAALLILILKAVGILT